MPANAMRAFYAAYLGALNTRDFALLEQHLCEQIVLNGRPVRRPELVAFLQGVVRDVPDAGWALEELIEDVDRLAVKLAFAGTPVHALWGIALQGRPFRVSEYAIYTLEEGRIAQITALIDMPALRAHAHA